MWYVQNPTEGTEFYVDLKLNFIVNILVILMCACDTLVRMKYIQICHN
jgi:hypothetical protein